MSKHRKHIRRWPKLAAASAALAAYIAGAVLPMTSANANNLPPAPTCTATGCVWIMPDTAGFIDWAAPTNSSEIWIDIQSLATPWATPTHLRAQLRDTSRNLLIYFANGGANVGIGSYTFYRVNADPGNPWGYDSSLLANVTFEPVESAPGAFVRIRQVIAPGAVAPEPAVSPTPTPDPTPTPTVDALPAPTSSPEPVATPVPSVTPVPSASAAPEVFVQVAPIVVAEPVQTATPVATSEPVAKAEPVQAVEPREETQGVAAVIPDLHPPAPPAHPTRVVVQGPEPAIEAAPEPETLSLRPSVQESAIAGVGEVPQKTESAIPAWAAAGVATLAATLALVGGVQLIRKRGVRIPRKLPKLRGSTGRRPGKLRVS